MPPKRWLAWPRSGTDAWHGSSCSPSPYRPNPESIPDTEKENAMTNAMTDHRTGTREEWLSARLELLDAEKELTRRGDELARLRQELPWVPIDKEYVFETDEGTASLADLFK